MKCCLSDCLYLVISFFKRVAKYACAINYLDSMMMLVDSKLCLRWANDPVNKDNFGDALNPILIREITGKRVVCSWNVINIRQKPVICFIGSILDNLNRNNAVICGAGFQKESATIKIKPAVVVAVRGPLSREILIKNKVECPEVYGDPAILLPLYVKKKKQKKQWDVGIIAHYSDKNSLEQLPILASGYSYKVINVNLPVEKVIDEICSSKFILSSSLHGIIAAHSYGVPATWIKVSENVIGGSFKFNDYAFSVNNSPLACYQVGESLDLKKGVEKSVLFDLNEMAHILNDALKEYFGAKVGS